MRVTKEPYHIPDIEQCCEYYNELVGPNGFSCVLTEPEDRTWYRDGASVIIELNRLYNENQKLKRRLKGN